MRAGYGIFYNRALLRTLDDFVLTSGALRIDTNTDLAAPLLNELKFPAPLTANDPRVAQYGVREAGFLRRLESGFRISESYQASAGFEREIARGFKIEVNYLFNRGLHLWRETNANAPRLPAGFADFAAYLTSRDFDNALDPKTGVRPITAASNADIVRFNRTVTPTQTLRENGKTVVVFGLNNPSTSNATNGIRAALAAIRGFRPNPGLTQLEELQARGNSTYHGVSFEAQRRLGARGSVRANYTLSKLTDDGVVNTSSAVVAGDFARERSLSLLDARHRVAVSGYYQMPAWLGRLAFSSTFTFASSRRFNLGANGNDRNLDDVDNDRPNYSGDLDAITWRRPSGALDPTLFANFSLPTIGTVGNLPRNAGHGPRTYTLNTRIARPFHFGERRHLELQLEAFNPFNSSVFSFGAEYADYAPNAAGDFLAAPRTIKPRTLRLGVKFEF